MHSRASLKKVNSLRTNGLSLCVSGFVVTAIACGASAQTAQVPAVPSAPKTIPSVAPSDTWLSLTTKQKASLAPLEKSWNSLSEGQRRKWLALSESYPNLAQPEQEKLHSRMVEWAALSPKDREAARLNFAQSKSIAKSDRAANWESYQALSPEEREKLAQGGKSKLVGAAVAVKPVPPDKLTAVPVTRHTPEQERAAAVLQRPINRSTLLPQLPASAPGPSSASTPPKP
ncbi:hypothetical protein DIC66_10960 [Rhodoferax lacus]|uniref:DUF3106 domain-containing protein n=2 Tax=Rhodoferax lacus TaxID=2184758 RepID=A0A3E1REH4_9BURK|nr:hypothetical protein DIC66_10960 [Rhodoferax lacus]